MLDALLKTVPIALFFRGIIPGAFFVLSCAVAFGGWQRVTHFDGEGLLSMWLPAAAFAGIVVYTIHRSVFYAVIEALLNWTEPLRRRRSDWFRLIRKSTVSEIIWRWKTSGEKRDVTDLMRHISVWSDYAHFQYASAWCIALGAISGRAIAGGAGKWDCPLTVLFFVLLGCALISDWRLQTLVRRVRFGRENSTATKDEKSGQPGRCTAV